MSTGLGQTHCATVRAEENIMADAIQTRSARGAGRTHHRGADETHTGDPIAGMLDEQGVLSEEGERHAAVPDATLRELYRTMVICRRIDQEALNLQRQGEIGLWGPFNGHEAAQVGAALAMDPTDWIFPYYRDFAMTICRGVKPAPQLAIYRGLAHGAWNPYEHRLAPFIIPVGSQVPHAVGFAIGCKLDNEEIAVLVSSGEGATSTGDWHEAMNFAGVFQAPIVFLVENNQWAISVPMHQQVAGRIADRAQGYGFPGVQVDGSDVLTVYAVVRAAAERARRGEGPYLVEALTYRFQAHTTNDDPTRYRTDADVEPWRAKDAIAVCAGRLQARGAFDDTFERTVRDEAEERASGMRRAMLALPVPH